MLTAAQTRGVIERLDYPGWMMRVVPVGGGHGIQVRPPHAKSCPRPGCVPVWGRIWPVMEHHVESDVVRTVFLAIGVVEEHERREHFALDGKMVWDPHAEIL